LPVGNNNCCRPAFLDFLFFWYLSDQVPFFISAAR